MASAGQVLLVPTGHAQSGFFARKDLLREHAPKLAAIVDARPDDDRLVLEGIDESTLLSVMSFVYLGDCLVDIDNAVQVLDAAERLGLKHLVDKCMLTIHRDFSPSTVPHLLSDAACLSPDSRLCSELAGRVRKAFDDCVAHDAFVHMSLPGLRFLLRHAGRPLPFLIAAVTAWARGDTERTRQGFACIAAL